ncbi:MAG: tRNA (adenosine(37)-N6)-dimethylallyltransferase MiaA, partial [Campylobacteraceae bacterium]|nr:tRNA (adenosine(37)-N6)-dimethylallyltransferase MiaA [Campylobacteraceae bacterium]
MNITAILGATASGKTSKSLQMASENNAYILSLDSLSIYKEIDIASAKPTLRERGDIIHFGIDEIYPNENFNVSIFFNIFKEAKKEAKKNNKNLIIVGGTGFYLKSLTTGLSKKPEISLETKKNVQRIMTNLTQAYEMICKNDKIYAQKISKNDSYRIEKWLEIFLQTGKPASEYYKNNTQPPLIKNLEILEIKMPKEILRQRVELRTKEMIKLGLIDEVIYLEKTYSRAPNSLKAIGIK